MLDGNGSNKRIVLCPPYGKNISPRIETPKKPKVKQCPGKNTKRQVEKDESDKPRETLECKIPEELKKTLLRIYKGGYIHFEINSGNDCVKRRITINPKGSGQNDIHHTTPQRFFTGNRRPSPSDPRGTISRIAENLSIIIQDPKVDEVARIIAASEGTRGHYLLNLLPVSRITHDWIEVLGYDHSSKALDETLPDIPLNQLFVYITLAMILSQQELIKDIKISLAQQKENLQNQRVMKRKRNKSNKLVNLITSIITEIEFVMSNACVIISDNRFIEVYRWLLNNGLIDKSIQDLINEYQLEQ